MSEDSETLGWEVATFALEYLVPDDRCAAGSSAVWETYIHWCSQRRAVPLAFAVFNREFAKAAEAAGIVNRQVGAHVNFDGVRIENGVTA